MSLSHEDLATFGAAIIGANYDCTKERLTQDGVERGSGYDIFQAVGLGDAKSAEVSCLLRDPAMPCPISWQSGPVPGVGV